MNDREQFEAMLTRAEIPMEHNFSEKDTEQGAHPKDNYEGTHVVSIVSKIRRDDRGEIIEGGTVRGYNHFFTNFVFDEPTGVLLRVEIWE